MDESESHGDGGGEEEDQRDGSDEESVGGAGDSFAIDSGSDKPHGLEINESEVEIEAPAKPDVQMRKNSGLKLKAADRRNSDTKKSYDDPYQKEKLEIVKTINESRAREGLEALIMDWKASEAANVFAYSMVEHKYKSQYDLNGSTTFNRYSKFGLFDIVAENVEGNDADADDPYVNIDSQMIDKELKRIHRRIMSEPPEGIRRQHTMSTVHTHIGIGFAISEKALRYIEVYINRYIELDPVPEMWPATLPLEITGRILRNNCGIFGCYVTFDHMPEPLSVTEIIEKDKLAEKAEKHSGGAVNVPDERLLEVWPWQMMRREDGTFSFYLNLDAQEGQFFLHIFIRDRKETIPYDYPIEGLTLPAPDLIKASTLVLEYDGRPLFLNADLETEFITNLLILDDPEVIMPIGYATHSLGYPFSEDEEVEKVRVCFTYEDTALPITEIALVSADSMENIKMKEDWEFCPVNLAPLLLGSNFQQNAAIVLAFTRSERMDGGTPLVNVKVSYNGDIPETFSRLELSGDFLPADNAPFLCYTHTLQVIELDDKQETQTEDGGEIGFEEEENDDEMEVKEFDQRKEVRNQLKTQLLMKQEDKERLIKENERLQKNLSAVMSVRQQGENREKAPNAEVAKRYSETLRQVVQAREALHSFQAVYDQNAVELQKKYDEKDATANEIIASFTDFKREIARTSENSRTGKSIPLKIVNQFELTEKKKDEEVEKVRLKNINLRTQLRKLEQSLREKEQLAEGLHLIDFEQLKIENQTLNEKIEERNEELHKLRKKTTTTVQVLTHIKEKLQFVQSENLELKKELSALENDLGLERDLLTKAKHERDRLRSTNEKLRQQQGFASSSLLVKDFEARKVEIEELQIKLQELQNQHRYLIMAVSPTRKTSKQEI